LPKTNSDVTYIWAFKHSSDSKYVGNGQGNINKTTEEILLSSDLILETGMYVLELTLKQDNETIVQSKTIATLPVRDREAYTLQFFTIAISIILSIFASILTSLIITNIIG